MILNSSRGGNVMNNIVFEKVWQDDDLVELKILAESEFVTAYQKCYIQQINLEEVSKKIIKYTKDFTKDQYLELGKMEGNYTSTFAMNLLKADTSGHLKIEVDIEVADIDNRSHRCRYFVESELGAIERLGHSLMKLVSADVGSKVSLY